MKWLPLLCFIRNSSPSQCFGGNKGAKMQNSYLAVVLLAGLASTAHAQDLTDRPFDGFSAGFKASYSGSEAEAISGARLPATFNDARFGGGGFVGYDLQRERTVVGLIVDFDYLNLEDQYTSFNGKGDQFDYDYDVDWAATARLRAGAMFSDNTLFYLTGGGAISEISFSENVASAGLPGSTPSSSASSSDVRIGGVVGLGFEYASDNGFFARSELLHYQFGSIGAGDGKIRPEVNTINIGIGYRF